MNFPFKVNEREKRFLIIGGVIIVLIILFHLYSLYGGFKKEANTFIDSKALVLEKQLRKLSERKDLEKRESEIKKDLVRFENLFLQGNKPPVAAAELQKTLKDMSSELGIEIRVERALNPVDFDFYTQIPVEIGFSTSTDKLRMLLEKLGQTAFLITISEIKVRVTNVRKPKDINVTLVVTGFIRKPGKEETEAKEAKNVA